jgi:hypothetical protein
MTKTIYISIPACKEKYLIQTIKSAIANAYDSSRLFFGVCNTVLNESDSIKDPFIIDNPQINYMEIHFPRPLGTGISRLNASFMSNRNHDYLFQIDAHEIFEKNWDKILIDSYEKLKLEYDKPILSCSPPWWQPDKDENIMLFGDKGYTVDPYNLDTGDEFSGGPLILDTEPDGTVFVHGDSRGQENEFKEHSLLFGAYVFTDFNFNYEIVHDPHNYWAGEQFEWALRAWTRGYRIFSLKKIVCWTLNKYHADGYLVDDWRQIEDKKLEFWENYKSHSTIKQKDIWLGRYFGYWGAPSKELLDSYEKHMGVNFKDLFKE